MQQVKEF